MRTNARLSTVLALLVAAPTAGATTFTVMPVADTYVNEAAAPTSYGTLTALRVDGSPVVRSYLRFQVAGLDGPVASAVLRLYANSAQSTGWTASSVADATWSETGTTYANAPAVGSARGSSGAVMAGTWTQAAVTAGVTGDGVVSFALTTTSGTALSMASRESANRPQLVITTQASPPPPPPPPPPGGDPEVAAAGDIACDPGNTSFNGGAGTSSNCRQRATSDLLVGTGLTAVLPLGDNQNYCGSLTAYRQSYDPTWGRVKAISHPVPGNHEYLTSGGGSRGGTGCDSSNAGAAGYFAYWGAAAGQPDQGYYSYDIGSWHVVALNTNCSSAGGCSASSPQGVWLKADLAATARPCILATFHIPLFSSGGRASPNARPLWDQLYAAHADVVLDGHDHIYERFAPQSPTGAADPAGIREFIVGTGGENHTSIASVAANSEVRNTDTYGVLRLTLHNGSYAWRFVPEAGKTFTDTGTGTCHRASGGGGDSTSAATFGPTADSYVDGSQPSSNFGTATQLVADASPTRRALLRFTVAGTAGRRVTSARLRLYCVNGSPVGGTVHGVASTTWSETGVTWGTAPAGGASAGSLGAVSAGSWYEVDVTSLVTGDGAVSLDLTSTNADGAYYGSREGQAAQAPQLVVRTAAPAAGRGA
jgi:hypothetical protein